MYIIYYSLHKFDNLFTVHMMHFKRIIKIGLHETTQPLLKSGLNLNLENEKSQDYGMLKVLSIVIS